MPWYCAIAAYVGRKFRQASSVRWCSKSWLPKSSTLETSTMPLRPIECRDESRSATATARTVP